MTTYRELQEELKPKIKKINDTWYRYSLDFIPKYKGMTLDIYKVNKSYYLALLDDSDVSTMRKFITSEDDSYRSLNAYNPVKSLSAIKKMAEVYIKYYEMKSYIENSDEPESEKDQLFRKLDIWLSTNK